MLFLGLGRPLPLVFRVDEVYNHLNVDDVLSAVPAGDEPPLVVPYLVGQDGS
jgi:hypothetical protein